MGPLTEGRRLSGELPVLLAADWRLSGSHMLPEEEWVVAEETVFDIPESHERKPLLVDGTAEPELDGR